MIQIRIEINNLQIMKLKPNQTKIEINNLQIMKLKTNQTSPLTPNEHSN